MRALIFDTEQEAKDWDFDNNDFTCNVTCYKYARRPLTDTTTLTKAEYAALMGIPEMLEDEEGVNYTNPSYNSLESSYTLNKCALMVGDTLDTADDEGNVTPHPDVVTLTEDDFPTSLGE